MTRRPFIFKALALTTALFSAGLASIDSLAQSKTVKVGILHSLSGTMAISETGLKDVALMAIEEINAKGGVMGSKIEAVVVDAVQSYIPFLTGPHGNDDEDRKCSSAGARPFGIPGDRPEREDHAPRFS